MVKKIKLLPDVEELKKLFYIDSSIPEGLRWKIKPKNQIEKDASVGNLVGKCFYFRTMINSCPFYNHRIIYSIFYNTNLTSDQLIDHIDRNPLNNHPDNLRIVTSTENNRNKTKRKNISSKYIGVSFYKQYKKFAANIYVNKKQIHLGFYLTEKDAALAYNNYIISHNLTHFNLNIIS